jgi:BirA family biotin operon repressor/biotin-[acetyl-CoA-carboxylase] ligase
MTPSAIKTLPTGHVGKQIRIYDRVDSTNEMALAESGEVASAGTVWLAREQTAGRGQYGRSWQAPRDTSVLMSVLLFPPFDLRRPAILTAWAAVAVCDTVAALIGTKPSIKWPNDILLAGKKVCGILCEQRTLPHMQNGIACVVGIGLNVGQSQQMFADAGLPDAASLASLSGQSIEWEEAADALILNLDRHYDCVLRGSLDAVENHWRNALGLEGRTVVAIAGEQCFRGRLTSLGFDGIDLELAGGAHKRLSPESIRQLRIE